MLSHVSRVWLFETPRTVAHQAPLSMGFSRQEYWSGLLFPPTGDLPHPGIKPTFPMSPALASKFFTTKPPGKPNFYCLSMWIISNLLSLLVHDLWAQRFWNSPLNPALSMLHQVPWSVENWVITGPVKWCLGLWDHPPTSSSTSSSFTSASEMIVSRKKTNPLTSHVRNRFMYVRIYLCKESFTRGRETCCIFLTEERTLFPFYCGSMFRLMLFRFLKNNFIQVNWCLGFPSGTDSKESAPHI